MNFLQKIALSLRQKSVIASGGIELLRRLHPGSMDRASMLKTYGSSLYAFACVRAISQNVASVPVSLFSIRNSDGDMQEIKAHEVLDLIYKPNPFQTKSEFWEVTMINLELTGEAFWFKVRDTEGVVSELWNLRPDMMEVNPDPQDFIKGYTLRKTDGTEVKFATEDIVHFKYPNPTDPYRGQSALLPGSARVQTEDYATAFQRDFFLNSARPDAVIKTPNALQEEQKEDIRLGWAKRYQGVGKTSKVAILEGGLDYQVISLTQKEMDYIETLKFTRDDFLVMFQVPKPVLSITDDVNLANAKTGMEIFQGQTVKPKSVRLVEQINEQLVIPDFDETLYLEAEDPTPKNRELQLQEYREGIAANYLLINEVRAMEGKPPVKGGWQIYQSVIMQPAGGLEPKDTPKPTKSFVTVGGETESKAYDGKPIVAVKRYDFRRNRKLYERLLAREGIMSEVKKELHTKYPSGPKKAAKWKKKEISDQSLLKDPDARRQYYNAENAKIDRQANALEEATNRFAEQQLKRVMEKFDSLTTGKGKGSKKKAVIVEVDQIFDLTQERKLSLEFILPEITAFTISAGQQALDFLGTGEAFQTTAEVMAFIQKRAEEFAISVNNTTLEGLETTLAEGIAEAEGIADMRARVGAVYNQFPEYRSELIGRTEATAANNEGLLQAYEQSEIVEGKEWVNAGDDRVRIEHQDQPVGVGAEIVGIRESFSNGLQVPNEYNCRCRIVAVINPDA